MKEDQRVLIAASGSGGHLFPAQFIAKRIKALYPRVELAFVGSGRPLEEKLIDGAGFTRFVLPLETLRTRNPLKLLAALLTAFLNVWRLFSQFKPDVIIGVGGYVSLMPVLVAWLRGVPSWIHEAEAKAGKANRLLSFFATRISLAFEDASIPCKRKCVFTGHPLREELSIFAAMQPGPVGKPSKLLVVGGSQGARGLDEGLCAIAPFLKEQGLEVWHQCRSEHVSMLQEAYEKASVNVRVVTFIDNMSEAYAWADIIVSRAGAGAVMELGVVGKPAILVPFPHAQGNHQKVNAMRLVKQGKALLCEEGEGFDARLKEALKSLMDERNYERILSLPSDKRSLNAADVIARGALTLRET